jgi:hypothetical protein
MSPITTICGEATRLRKQAFLAPYSLIEAQIPTSTDVIVTCSTTTSSSEPTHQSWKPDPTPRIIQGTLDALDPIHLSHTAGKRQSVEGTCSIIKP